MRRRARCADVLTRGRSLDLLPPPSRPSPPVSPLTSLSTSPCRVSPCRAIVSVWFSGVYSFIKTVLSFHNIRWLIDLFMLGLLSIVCFLTKNVLWYSLNVTILVLYRQCNCGMKKVLLCKHSHMTLYVYRYTAYLCQPHSK